MGKLKNIHSSSNAALSTRPRCSHLHTSLGLLARFLPEYIKKQGVKGAEKLKARQGMGSESPAAFQTTFLLK